MHSASLQTWTGPIHICLSIMLHIHCSTARPMCVVHSTGLEQSHQVSG